MVAAEFRIRWSEWAGSSAAKKGGKGGATQTHLGSVSFACATGGLVVGGAMKKDDEALEDAPTHRRLHTVRSRLLAMDYNEVRLEVGAVRSLS